MKKKTALIIIAIALSLSHQAYAAKPVRTYSLASICAPASSRLSAADGDYTSLATAVSEANTYIATLDRNSYPTAAVEEYMDAVRMARTAMSIGGYEQSQIDALLQALTNAKTKLEASKGFVFNISDIKATYDTQRGFRHPGGLHTDEDFARIKRQIAAGKADVVSAYNKLISAEYSQSGIQTYPVETIVRGGSGQNYVNAARGATMAYQNALRWKIDGTTANADAAVRILMAWANTTKYISGDSNQKLASGLYGYEFAQAAELMRDYDGWSREDFNKFRRWMLDVWYPQCINFMRGRNGTWENAGGQAGGRPGHYWSNWPLCNDLALISIGILCDDVFIYNQGISYMKYDQVGDGGWWWIKNKAAAKYEACMADQLRMNEGLTEYIDNLIPIVHSDNRGAYGKLGQMQETGRDQGHATMALGLAVDICQTAWNQGDDLFSYHDNRMAAGIEWMAGYNNAMLDDLPWTEYQYADCRTAWHNTWNMTAPNADSRGQTRPYWARVIGHYEGVKGVKMQYAEQALQAMGIDGGGTGSNSGDYDHLGYSVLTCTYDGMATNSTKPTLLTPKMTYNGTIIEHNELGGLTNTWQTTDASQRAVPVGSVITLQPVLPQGETNTGKWLWNTGQTSQSITITANSSYVYRVQYTNANGVKSFQNFSIAVDGDCETTIVTPTIEYNGTTLKSATDITVSWGDPITLSISGQSGWGYVTWENGQTTASITIPQVTTSRSVRGYYENQGGRKQLVTFNIKVEDAPAEDSGYEPYLSSEDGWTEVTDLGEVNLSGNYFAFVDKENSLMLRMQRGIRNNNYNKCQTSNAVFYRSPVNPVDDKLYLWTLEQYGNEGHVSLKNAQYDDLYVQCEGSANYFETHDVATANQWSEIVLTYSDGRWTMKPAKRGVVGAWGTNVQDGAELGCDASVAGTFGLYRIPKQKFDELYAARINSIISSCSSATPANPVELTELLQNANFNYCGEWTSSNTTNIVASGNGAMGVESWNSSAFKCVQTISGLPEGYYHIATNGMYRYNTNKNNTNQSAQTAHTDGSEMIHPYLSVNGERINLKSVCEYGSIPNTAADFLNAFSMNGNNYPVNMYVQLKGGNDALEIGIKKDQQAGCDWAVWSGVRVFYLGKTLDEATAAKVRLCKDIAHCEAMRREYTDMRLMNAAVSAAMPAYDSKDATVSDIASAKAALANGFGQAIKAYASTQTPVELTSWLADTDGDRDEEGVNGWTRSGKAANYSLVIGANADSEEYAGKAIEYWQQWAEWNWIHMYQVVGMPLPEGTYTLSTIGRSYYDGKGKGTHGGVHAFAYKGALSKFETMTESDFLSLTANAYSKNFKQESLGFTLSEPSEVTVGLWGDATNTYNWDAIAQVRLYYFGENPDELVISDESAPACEEITYPAVRVNRSLKKGVWNTVCLPMRVDCIPEGWKVKELESTVQDETSIVMNFKDVTEMLAGKPYLVKTTEDSDGFVIDNAAMSTVCRDIVCDGLTMKGTIETGFVPEGCYFLSGGKMYVADDADYTGIRGMRAYFSPHEHMEIKALRMAVDDDDAAGMAEMMLGDDDSEDMMVYSLTGMLTQSPAYGVYIVKRKDGKVIKKLKMKK